MSMQIQLIVPQYTLAMYIACLTAKQRMLSVLWLLACCVCWSACVVKVQGTPT